MKKRHIKLEKQLKNSFSKRKTLLTSSSSSSGLSNDDGNKGKNQKSEKPRSRKRHDQFSDNERLILEEKEPIDNEKFYLNKDEEVPYDYFSALNLNDIDTNLDFEHINKSANFDDLWILLWIFKYQKRFHLSNDENIEKIPTVKGHIWRPKLVFSLSSLKDQFATMYQRSGFE
ncbi:1147_t:CDS:2 [Funneliformis caledonium]|uniref:1147_t:CDS:1 n=1 Tax=Funneliformis caledonium TaxID=1117310 RepID=A0A9N9D7N3_9GLOM|nr:1147_t:CDS:2 [Funneliformis caledonium]